MVGLLAVELFETGRRRSLVNELAMRPHNSGHWTIEGARTSQFEQHLRAVLDYPMGDTALTAPVVVMANVLGGAPGGMSIDERLHHLFAAEPGRQGAPLRQAGPARPQDRARHGARRRPGRRYGRAPRGPPAGCREGDVTSDRMVGVIMGSDSDWPTMQAAAEALDEFGVPVRGPGGLRAPHAASRCSTTPTAAADRGLQGDHRRRRRRRRTCPAWSPR